MQSSLSHKPIRIYDVYECIRQCKEVVWQDSYVQSKQPGFNQSYCGLRELEDLLPLKNFTWTIFGFRDPSRRGKSKEGNLNSSTNSKVVRHAPNNGPSKSQVQQPPRPCFTHRTVSCDWKRNRDWAHLMRKLTKSCLSFKKLSFFIHLFTAQKEIYFTKSVSQVFAVNHFWLHKSKKLPQSCFSALSFSDDSSMWKVVKY